MTSERSVRNIRLGDMMVVGDPPAKLWKALAVIADALHPGFDLHPEIVPGKSKESCVLCSLTVRVFLRAIGIEAKVAPVTVIMWADQNGRRLHSLGIGHSENQRLPDDGYWSGHLVVTAEGFVIDTTLYSARREQWPDLADMVALPINRSADDESKIFGLDQLAGATIADDERGYSFNIGWLDNPKNKRWREGPDARDRARRLPVVRHLIKRFGKWEDDQAVA
jgi:hypothetical protein